MRTLPSIILSAVAGLVTMPVGAAEPAALSDEARLGKRIFFDTRLSNPPGQACGTCHVPSAAFSDPDRSLPTSRGAVEGRAGNRNTPTAMYAAYSPTFHFDAVEQIHVGGQFFDGRAATLEAQAGGPFLDAHEMANESEAMVVEKLRTADYAAEFKRLYGESVFNDTARAFADMTRAIAAYERSAELNPFSSKYDAYLAGRTALSAQEARGLKLFEDPGKGNCAACHPSQPAADGSPPLFTDYTYDNLGIPRHPNNPFYTQALNALKAKWIDPGLGAFTGKPSERGLFKVPTLRNIAKTAPYMHNGYFDSLRGSVAFYNSRDAWSACEGDATEAEALARRCWPAAEIRENMNTEELGNLKLSAQEIDDITAFMHTLTDGWQAP